MLSVCFKSAVDWYCHVVVVVVVGVVHVVLSHRLHVVPRYYRKQKIQGVLEKNEFFVVLSI